MQLDSNLDGKTLQEAGFVSPVGFELLSIRREGGKVAFTPEEKLRGGDVLAFTASADSLLGLWAMIGMVPAYGTAMKSVRHQHQLVEVVVSRNARAVGRRISELPRARQLLRDDAGRRVARWLGARAVSG